MPHPVAITKAALAVLLMVLVVSLPLGAMASVDVVDLGRDEVIPPAGSVTSLAPQATDPLGLVPGIDIVRFHSLGTDVIDVWTCDISADVDDVVAQLDTDVAPYFAAQSQGRLHIDFVARGSAQGGEQGCMQTAADGASDHANGVLIAGPWSGGLGGPGHGPATNWPYNDRWALVGYDRTFSMVAAHELGHTQTWPHSYTGVSGNDYDNALDLMSGNYGQTGGGYGTFDLPYETAVINRYAAGWIDPDQVEVIGSGPTTFTLEPYDGEGIQMAVIQADSSYYTLGARSPSTYDPIPAVWAGVEVYEVIPCPEANIVDCLNDPDYDMGFRRQIPLGQVPFDPGDLAAYSRPLTQVIREGTSKTVQCREVSVAAAGDGAYQVSVSGSGLCDLESSVFAADIEWLAGEGITKGCNPPVNDRFCPDDAVTRGQMAAFLHRALPDLPLGSPLGFTDEGPTFAADIEWLASAGVTKGCNPPVNDRFCPDDAVTRGQMAAFLHRALGG
ncbi:MAG: S-layer homology domain-containing protein [Acidimicrobiia bacterium]